MTLGGDARVGASPPSRAGQDQAYRLAPHVRDAELGDLVVLLDLRGNRYQATPKAKLADALLGDPRAGEVRSALCRAGLIEPVLSIETSRIDADWKTLRRLITAWVWARAQVRRGRLDLSFTSLARRKLLSRAACNVGALYRYYHERRPWFPLREVCLFDSLAFAWFALGMGAQGIDLVLGVQGMPFAAHCWIEADGAIVNDEALYCASFTPIARV